MDQIIEPFSKESILNKLIAKRVKAAKRIHDKFILENYTLNSKPKMERKKEDIFQYMPSRKNWVTLGKNNRQKQVLAIKNSIGKTYISKDSISKNKKRIILTIAKDSKLKQQPDYLVRLNSYINDIINDFTNNTISISAPMVIPKKKDEKGEQLRPLCIFPLRDNLILQETNSFLIKNFDSLFYDCSYAFRGKRIFENKIEKIPTHHDTVDKIIQYQEKHKDQDIYVTEYDLKKFFDTIDHSIIRKKFKKLLNNKAIKISDFWKIRVEHIFEEYLNCYTFYKNVFSINDDKQKLKKFGYPKGKFEWVEDELEKKYGKKFINKEIGIPQGGALSGFIANLVLNEADEKLMKLNDPDLLYLRYCDDMIMLHTNKRKLEKAAKIYKRVVKRNKLFIHKPENKKEDYNRSFYDSKSRELYIWGDIKEHKVPWISFVGYQIGFNGEVRIRCTSIKKELKKQEKIVHDTIQQISLNPIKNPNMVIRSVIHRLQGMSVGHVNLYSKDLNPSLCWVNGFQKINKNKYTKQQMKGLDKNRCKQISKLCYEVYKIKNSQNVDNSVKNLILDDPQIIYSGKPFSYYGWLEHK